MQPVYPAFGTRPVLYMPPTTVIRDPNNILSPPLGQHILKYEPPRGFSIPTFAMFNGSSDPYDHMLHYNQAMILNVRNDHLLCKVFQASLQGHVIRLIRSTSSRPYSSLSTSAHYGRKGILVLCKP